MAPHDENVAAVKAAVEKGNLMTLKNFKENLGLNAKSILRTLTENVGFSKKIAKCVPRLPTS